MALKKKTRKKNLKDLVKAPGRARRKLLDALRGKKKGK